MGYIRQTQLQNFKTFHTEKVESHHILSSYGAKQRRDGAWRVNSDSAVEGALEWKDAIGGATGALYALGVPTGYYDDRYTRLYEIPTTGIVDISGSTGINGLYQTTWSMAMAGITGIAHGDFYGLVLQAGVTGPHGAAEIVYKVEDTIK